MLMLATDGHMDRLTPLSVKVPSHYVERAYQMKFCFVFFLFFNWSDKYCYLPLSIDLLLLLLTIVSRLVQMQITQT